MSNVKRIVAMGIIVLFGTVVVYILIRIMPYESRYFGKLGVDKYRYLYSDMLRDFGEPKEILTLPSGAISAIQDEFMMIFGSESMDSLLLSVTVTGEKYRFGWKSIGVGSTKEDVLRAYSNVSWSSDSGVAFVDGYTYVEFYFDEDGIVDKMKFMSYP